MKGSHDEQDAIIDANLNEEVVPEETEAQAAVLASKLKSVRKELMAAQKEVAEHLAGWQRAKADLINYRKAVEADRERDAARARGAVIRSLLPVMDSFESAMADASWASTDPLWRSGVERIADQLKAALRTEGCFEYGDSGDAFDPAVHECVSVTPTDDARKDDTVAHVLQKGYRIGDEVIRPAKVVVAQHNGK